MRQKHLAKKFCFNHDIFVGILTNFVYCKNSVDFFRIIWYNDSVLLKQ